MKVFLSHFENEKGEKKDFFFKVEMISLPMNKEFIISWSRGVKHWSTWTNKNILILGNNSNLTTIGSFCYDCTQTHWELSNNTQAQQKGGKVWEIWTWQTHKTNKLPSSIDFDITKNTLCSSQDTPCDFYTKIGLQHVSRQLQAHEFLQ